MRLLSILLRPTLAFTAPLVKVAIGVAVKAGAAQPAMSSVEDFKQAVLAALFGADAAQTLRAQGMLPVQ